MTGRETRCHYVFDREVGRLHIPGCMGAAVYGPRGCTCPPKPRKADMDRIDRLEERLEKLERRLAADG